MQYPTRIISITLALTALAVVQAQTPGAPAADAPPVQLEPLRVTACITDRPAYLLELLGR